MKHNEEEYTEHTHKLKAVLKGIRLAIVVFAVATVSLLVLFNIDQINMDNIRRLLAKIDFSINRPFTSANAMVTFNGSEQNCYAEYKSGLAVLSADGLKVFDDKGNEFTSQQTIYHSPSMQTNKKYILTYDRGGKTLNIANSFALVFTKTFDNTILNASMSENGAFVVVTQYEGYKALVTVFDSSFKEVFKFYSADKYIIDADISPDGAYLAAATLASEEAAVTSGITIYKIGTESPISQIPIAEGVLFDIKYKSSGNICAITDKGAVFISKDGKTEKELSFDGMILNSYADNNDKYTAFITSASTSGKTAIVTITDEKGNIWTKGETDGFVISSSFSANGLAILQQERVILAAFSSKEGIKNLKTIPIKNDYERILAGDGNAFLIDGNYADIISLK